LEVLLKTLREFPLKARKRITFEYVMLGGVNDTDDDLKRIPELIEGIPSKLNLIPYNENAGLGFKSSPVDRVRHFQRALLDRGINATIRWSKGDDISAACGQLATAEPRAARTSQNAPEAPLA
ncbi:MAG: 23S rRNA (adenine(2503)-C(2))-methyltransferase RlmN, partial [Deltaproteobacteria bacterium]|nr:23S rRNA (adenine(2503)-C(2))-methyltransferase RlmN [Deltaproteobacteria bacterium]